MNLTKNQMMIIAAIILVVVAYFMFFRKKKSTAKVAAPAAPADKAESNWAPQFTSEADAMKDATGGWAGMYGRQESGYDGLTKFQAPTAMQGLGGNWLGY